MTVVYLLTGDVGGTNSRMSLYDAKSDCGSTDKPLVVKYYRNAEHLPNSVHNDPEAFSKHVVSAFVSYCWSSGAKKNLPKLNDSVVIVACLATAGIVQDNRVNMTNLGNLLVDGTAIENNNTDKYLKHIKVCKIINDFVAQGYGCLTLKSSEVELLYGPKDSLQKLDNETNNSNIDDGPKVCVGAGTGLGECYLTPYPTSSSDDNTQYSYLCFASEGGHVEYAPHNDLEVRLWKYLMDKYSGKNRISVERVVSGMGLANVYEFLASEFPELIEKKVHDKFLIAGDEQGKVIGVNALRAKHAAAPLPLGSPSRGGNISTDTNLCKQAMTILMKAYGSEVSCAAIKFIPTGGLFVTGGLTPKNMDFIRGKDSEFMSSYLNKGRVSPVLEKIPLFAVLVEDLGVRGAHKAAKTLYEQHRHNYDDNNIIVGGSNDEVGGGAATRSRSSTSTSLLTAAILLGGVIGAIVTTMLLDDDDYTKNNENIKNIRSSLSSLRDTIKSSTSSIRGTT